MGSTLPELEGMLVDTAAAQIDAAAAPSQNPVGKRPRRRLARLGAPRLVALGCLLILCGGTAMAATGIWDPPIGVLTGKAPPRTSDSPVPAAITNVLGILRREQTEKDRSIEVEATLSRALFADGIRPHSVRYLAPSEADGEATVLFSATGSHHPHEASERICLYRPFFPSTTAELPACFDRATLLAGGARIAFETGSQRLEEVLEAGSKTEAKAIVRECSERPVPALCLPTKVTAVGLVPDGVATVTLHFIAAPDVNVPVHENYFELELHGAQITHVPIGVRYIVMRDAKGRVVPPR